MNSADEILAIIRAKIQAPTDAEIKEESKFDEDQVEMQTVEELLNLIRQRQNAGVEIGAMRSYDRTIREVQVFNGETWITQKTDEQLRIEELDRELTLLRKENDYLQSQVDRLTNPKPNTTPNPCSEVILPAHPPSGRGSRVEVLPGGQNLGERGDMDYFFQQLGRGLRMPNDDIQFLSKQFMLKRYGLLEQSEEEKQIDAFERGRIDG